MWQGILGQGEVVDRFRRTLARGRLASTYLFVGPPGVGKQRFALQLSKTLLCGRGNAESLQPCGRCESCRLFDAGNHPDLDIVGLPPDKTKLPIELFLGSREHRHQEGLCHRISLKPFLGRRRIAIIDDADHFNQESANCLLKTLEEPPPRSLVILIGTSPSRQLPTIRSRSQVVRFAPLSPQDVEQILLSESLAADARQAALVAKICEGSIARAVELADPALLEFREHYTKALASPQGQSVRLAQAVQAQVDAAGKEPYQRRDRLRQLVGLAIEHYRALLRGHFVGGAKTTGFGLGESQAPHVETNADVDGSLAAIDHCLAALEHLDRNANLNLVIQNLCEELSEATARSTPN